MLAGGICHPTPLTRSERQTVMDVADRQTIVLSDKQYEMRSDKQQQKHDSALPSSTTQQEDEDDTQQLAEHYRLTHQVMRDATYLSLLFEQRRELHPRWPTVYPLCTVVSSCSSWYCRFVPLHARSTDRAPLLGAPRLETCTVQMRAAEEVGGLNWQKTYRCGASLSAQN